MLQFFRYSLNELRINELSRARENPPRYSRLPIRLELWRSWPVLLGSSRSRTVAGPDEEEFNLEFLQRYGRLVCPHCGEKIDEYFFADVTFDKVIRDLDTGALSFEVVTNCLRCGRPIYTVLWLVEINHTSKLDAIRSENFV